MRILDNSIVALDQRVDRNTLTADVRPDPLEILSREAVEGGWQRARTRGTGYEVLVRATEDQRIIRNWSNRIAREIEVREIETQVEDRDGKSSMVAGLGPSRLRGVVREEYVTHRRT